MTSSRFKFDSVKVIFIAGFTYLLVKALVGPQEPSKVSHFQVYLFSLLLPFSWFYLGAGIYGIITGKLTAREEVVNLLFYGLTGTYSLLQLMRHFML